MTELAKNMKRLILTLMACACAFFVMAGEGQCDNSKSKSECPAKKACGDKGGDKCKDNKDKCPKDQKDCKGQKT